MSPKSFHSSYIKPKLTGPAGELARLRALSYSQPPQPGSPAPPPELSLQACMGLRYFRGFSQLNI